MKFSQRIGKTPEKKEIQFEKMDLELRTRLWNVISTQFIDLLEDNDRYSNTAFKLFCKNAYHDFFKYPIDKISPHRSIMTERFRKFFFDFQWFEVYDFMEFILSTDEEEFEIELENLIVGCNQVLEQEFSAYRIVKFQVAQITNELEINQVEEAIKLTREYTSYTGANIHLSRALELLSDKRNPDFRNSIKESISAIESVSKVISGNQKDSLGGALDKIKGKLNIHASLERGFKQLYGYTSDSDGIRHALMDSSNCSFEDALYMLVSSSSFINYLIAKSEKGGINIK
ncbi:MAG: hypothetical protein EOO99_11950 [Pedobacter sp.]|nr:MAG: hypothetical protein EOO99_11950 [Pedobacter sp.]